MAGSFTFSWRIVNFSMCLQKTKEFIKSPTFKIECLNNVEGHLRFYPHGRNNSKCTTCSFIIASGQYPKSRIKLIISSEDCRIEIFSNEFSIEDNVIEDIYVTSLGDDIYKEESLFLHEDTLTIKCEIENQNSASTSSEVCFGRTIVQTECLLNLPLASNMFIDPSVWGLTQEYSTNLEFQRHFPETCAEFKFLFRLDNSNNRIINVQISKLTAQNKILLSMCKVLFRSDSELNCMFQSKYLFDTSSENSPWRFSFTINSDEMKSLESSSASLIFEFKFSDGSLTHEIDKNRDIQYQTCVPKAVGNVLKTLGKIYNSKKFSDVIVQVGSAQYPAHKCVLSAVSPVFEAMFASDMIEVEKGIVIINDIDASTLEKMLLFLHTGTIENLDMDSAAKVYSAADKYQIIELKEECLSYLKANLANENICEVLEKANLHQDRELETAARNYIYSHQREVFNSESWNSFMGRQIHLAAEVMHQVCKKKSI